jgi:hypothetical protein
MTLSKLVRTAMNVPAAVVSCAVAAFVGPALAADHGGQAVRFQLGLTAVSGMGDLEDKIAANNPAFATVSVSPVGLSAALAYRFADDWSVVGSLGPIIVGTGDASFTIVPIGLALRYELLRGASGAAYVRLGVEQAIANGDFVETGSAGGVAALGYDFGDAKRGGFGLELAYRSAKVDVPGRTAAANKTAQPYKGSLTVYWAF